MVSYFVLSFFPRDVLDEILDFIESVPETFPTYSGLNHYYQKCTLQTYKQQNYIKSMKENPQKLTQLSSRSHPRHLVGKRTAEKETIIDITSDSQVNSNFPY